jgi:membrane protease YdiL (CAAX protease family)
MEAMARPTRLSFTVAARCVVALWLPYAALNTVFPSAAFTYTLGLAIAACALAALRLAGLSWPDLFVRLAWPSRAGGVLLLALLLFIPAALLAGRGQSWRPLEALVYAPLSGIGQELYFRSALLPVLLRRYPARPWLALALQALAFALWHARAFRVVPPAQAIVALLLLFAAGLLWGWQVRHDRTVLYAAAQHTLFLIVQ